MTRSITLYHWEPNANSGKPMLTLAEEGVAYESHYIDLLNFDQHKLEYLALNPAGTNPAMRVDDRVFTESTAIMEYVDAAFDGPRLTPSDPYAHWRMRWWMKYFDQYLAPSFSTIGWNVFIGPSVRSRDPDELKAAIDRIPMPERRVAWSKAIYGTFSADELAESQRRVAIGTAALETILSQRPWIAGADYSLANINCFNLACALPLSQPHLASDEKTPHIMEWLRKIYERPATRETWSKGRAEMAARVKFLERGATA